MRTSSLAGGLTASLFSLSLALAVAPIAARADASVPTVARLSLVQGNVAVQRSGSRTNVAGVLNAPLDAGDALTAGEGARAEVQFDGTSALRVDSGAQVRFATLDSDNRVIDVARGTVSLDLFYNAPVLPEIDTPSATIRADEDGRYRVTVADDGATFVTVRAGKAEIDLPQGTQYLVPGNTMKIAGSASNPTYGVVAFVPIDDFDNFNANRDSVLIAALGNSMVPGDVAAGNLNTYGAWVYDALYGEVWVPYANQTVGWAPYRDGSWTWGAQFGWTWVSYEPWGWAPYHYGRWFYNRGYGGWCWYPPHRRFTPWAPALVGWVTFGSGNFNLALGIGSVAWVPLAPWETYHPWYAYSRQRGWYGTAIGSTIAITNANDRYRNFAHDGATSVSGRQFAQGDFKHNRAVKSGELQHGVGYSGAMPVRATQHNAAFNTSRTLPTNLRDDRFAMQRKAAARTADSATRHSDSAARQSVPTYVNAQSASLGGGAWARFAQSRGSGRVPQRTSDTWSRFQANRGSYRAPQAQRESQEPQSQQGWQQRWQPQQRQESQAQQRQAPQHYSDNRSSDRHDDSHHGNH